jgi:putative phosphoserine phosphatase/1-acylglycerol-3-phosphate O-acyltransferase
MWRNSTTIRPGQIDVVVHPAIDVTTWTTDKLTERVADVRQLYLDTFAHWPTSEASR